MLITKRGSDPGFCRASHTSATAHASTAITPNGLRIQTITLTAIAAAMLQKIVRAHLSARAAERSRQPTTLAPRYPADATAACDHWLAGMKLRVRPLVFESIVTLLTLPPTRSVMT